MTVRKLVWRIFLALLGVAIAFVLAAETWLRLAPPDVLADARRTRTVGNMQVLQVDASVFERDEDIGLRPVLGGAEYGEHGALHNDYPLTKADSVERLLFIGDSVTYRGKIVAALRELYGEEGIEYWNGGVTGYSTSQELGYYRLFLKDIDADHVILTFHLNDFEATPVTFRDGDRLVCVYTKDKQRELVPWLWLHSRLYVFAQHYLRPAPDSNPVIAAEVLSDLAELAALVRSRGARFTVLVFPWLRPRDRWPGSLPGKHQRVLETLERLEVPYFTFLDELDQALAVDEEICEVPLDPQHPSDAFAHRMALSMQQRGFRP
jgi:lysophospholipase L1-like esterase